MYGNIERLSNASHQLRSRISDLESRPLFRDPELRKTQLHHIGREVAWLREQLEQVEDDLAAELHAYAQDMAEAAAIAADVRSAGHPA